MCSHSSPGGKAPHDYNGKSRCHRNTVAHVTVRPPAGRDCVCPFPRSNTFRMRDRKKTRETTVTMSSNPEGKHNVVLTQAVRYKEELVCPIPGTPLGEHKRFGESGRKSSDMFGCQTFFKVDLFGPGEISRIFGAQPRGLRISGCPCQPETRAGKNACK